MRTLFRVVHWNNRNANTLRVQLDRSAGSFKNRGVFCRGRNSPGWSVVTRHWNVNTFQSERWCYNNSVHQVVGHTRRALQRTQHTLLTAFFVASSIGWTNAVAVVSVNTWATVSEYKPQLQGPRSGLGAVASLQAASTATHPASAGSPSLLLGGRRVDLSPFSQSQYLFLSH